MDTPLERVSPAAQKTFYGVIQLIIVWVVMPDLAARTALVVVMVLIPDLVLVPLGWLEGPP